MPPPAPDYLADFDSATGMVRALGRFLHGQDFPGLGVNSFGLRLTSAFVNWLPRSVREQVYIWSGWGEAIRPEKLAGVSAEAISRWGSAPKGAMSMSRADGRTAYVFQGGAAR